MHLDLQIITNVYLILIFKIGSVLGKFCTGTSQPISWINIASWIDSKKAWNEIPVIMDK